MSSSKQGGWTFGKSGDNQSLLTAFRADDSLVEMIPQFEWPDKISLVSSSTCSALQRSSSSNCFGPFQPNVPTMVPLWLALHLQTKSLCRIIPPPWLTTDNLREILAFEKTSEILWPPPPPPSNNGNDYEDDDDVNVEAYYVQQRQRLPRNYYELANRLAPVCQDDCASAVQLLVTDLLQVRLDKLRQQFQNLLSEQSSSNNNGTGNGGLGLIVNISGIGTAEVACLRETVQQAMNDKEFLQKKTPSSSSSQSSKISKGSSSSSSSSTTDAAAASTTTTPVPGGGGRRLVRRFRGSVGRSNNNNKTITPGTT
jgi:hypothetical protein